MALSLALMAAAGGIALAYSVSARSAPALSALLLLPESRPIAPFERVDGAGGAVFDRTVAGSLVFFGCTHCPDVCPRGRLRGAFPPPLDAAAIARDLALLMDRDD